MTTGYTRLETKTYMFKSVVDVTKIIRSVLNKLTDTLDINVVDWWYKKKTLRHLEFNDNSLFDTFELCNNEYKLNGLQFIITQNRPYESNRITKASNPVEITHTLNFNSNEVDQFLYYNIPIKDTTPPIPAVLCICANMQLGYSPTPDITIYNKYDMRITIDTNKMTSNIHIHADKEIASEDNMNLNTPDYTELTEKLNAYDIRITRPIIVIVDLLTEVTKIAIIELKEYDDIDDEDKCIDDEKYITVKLFINMDTGMIEITVTEHVPVIWYAPTMDITYNNKKVLEGAYSLTSSPSASTVIKNDLIKAKTFNDCTKIVYKLKDLIDILTDVAYRN